MSPPRHSRMQGICKYPDGSYGVDAYIAGRRVRKKVGGLEAARNELARLKAEELRGRSRVLIGPNFDEVRHALATIEDQVAALRDSLGASRAREQAARSALTQLIEAVERECPGQLDEELRAAQAALEQLYLDAK